MLAIDEVFISLDGIRKKFDEQLIKENFKGFKRDIQFKFPDIGAAYILKITEAPTASLTEGTVDFPHILVEMDSATFLGIRTKKISGAQAYATGKLKIKGTITDLLKMQKLM